MPQIANIVVKKADGTTDITYTAVSPAAGPEPAVWKSQTIGTSAGQQPELRCSSKGRVVKGNPYRDIVLTYKYPKSVSNSTTGEITISEGLSVAVQVHANQTMAQADLKEAAYQIGNLISSTLIKQSIETGYSPY